uniref:Uncharacterized protein n=1 Tax=Romanomermis culicivorax TaxID=13658 RepID=A0A915I2G2_ROMCU
MSLKGKVAIITGSTAGIGLAIAKRLGLDGCKIMISSRKSANVDKAIEHLKADGIKEVEGTVCHVGKSIDRDNIVDVTMKKFGRIDILVNNAGINPVFGNMLDVNELAWDKTFDTNVKAGFFLTQKVVPLMESVAGGGNVVFVSSITGYTPFQGIGLYSTTKTALLGMVKALAMSCAPHNVRVNAIAPGIVKTDFSKFLWDNEKSCQFYENMIPLGRFGKAEDCSGVVSFLCSDDASYITGETIVISGGVNARL